LQEQSEAPEFWSAPDEAQKVMKSIADLSATLDEWQKISTDITELNLWSSS